MEDMQLRDFKYFTCAGKIYANEGIAQLIFLESDEICETSYADKRQISGTAEYNSTC